jgi:putative aldouronate transport system permease protein
LYMLSRLKLDLKRNHQAYLMVLPAVVLIFIFAYIPMYGILIAFQNFRPAKGIWGSEWVGLKYFIEFFEGAHTRLLLRNTLIISLYSLVVCFPAPIILALLLNEVRVSWFKRTVQTISYMPYFISTVVICGMLKSFLAYDGVINEIVKLFGGSPENYLSNPAYFRSIIVFSGLWQGVGWGSIIYMAALTGIDPTLYEAARIDGCGRLRQMLHVTLPGIVPTIAILLIMDVGSIMSVSSDKILLLYSPLTYETGDVIGTYIYRRGIRGAEYGFTTAIGLFETLVNFLLLILANEFSRRVSDNSLW